MTRELFLEIIRHDLYAYLFIIIISYMLGWLVAFKLGCMILGVGVSPRRITPAIFIMAAYIFWGKQMLPIPLFGIIMIFLGALLLWLNAKDIHPLRVAWAAILMIVCSNSGGIVIMLPICSVYPAIANFLLKTPLGYIVGTEIEIMCPLLVLFLLPRIFPKYKISILPPVRVKPDSMDFTAFITYFAMYLTNYITAIVLYLGMNASYRPVFPLLVFLWLTATTTVLAHYRLVKTMRERFEGEKAGLEADKSRLEEEKAELEAEKTRLEEEKGRLEAEKNELLKKIRKLAGANNIETALKSQQFDAIVNDFIGRLNNIKNPAVEVENHRETGGMETTGHVLKPVIWAQYDLNPRERLILKCIVEGKLNKEIADQTYLTEGTIKNLMTKLFRKLGVKDRIELARFAIEKGLVEKG